MRWIIVLALMALGYILGALLAVSIANADHEYEGCDTVRGPQTWSILPTLDASPWQFAQRDIVFGDTQRRQWLTQVPWGEPADIYILPTDGAQMWVQAFCTSGQSIIWAPDVDTEYLRRWAAHEFLHHWRLGDHRWWSLVSSAGYWPPATFCDGPQPDPYDGIMSYCNTDPWGPDDQAMLIRMWQ